VLVLISNISIILDIHIGHIVNIYIYINMCGIHSSLCNDFIIEFVHSVPSLPLKVTKPLFYHHGDLSLIHVKCIKV